MIEKLFELYEPEYIEHKNKTIPILPLQVGMVICGYAVIGFFVFVDRLADMIAGVLF
jgi:hypothetical protein